VPFFILINDPLTYCTYMFHFQYYSGCFTALVPLLSFAFHVPDCTVPFSASSENIPVSYHVRLCFAICRHIVNSVDKKNQLDVTFCILYFSSNRRSTCFGRPCAYHQELTTAWCYSLVLVCALAAGMLSRPVGR